MTRKVVLDTDPGCDDAVAIALALAADELEVVGLTTVASNSTIDNVTHNARAILELFDRTDVPVVEGCGRPLAHELETAEEIHGEGGITGDLPEPSAETRDGHASAFLRELADEHGDELTVLGLGPLTNLAAATAVDPGFPGRVGEFVIMGGAARVTGNRTPMAEANFYSDPPAARRVLGATDARLIGLDVTHDAEVPPSTVAGDGPRAAALAAWLDYYPDWVREPIDLEHAAQHDAVAVADLLADVVTYDEAAVDVLMEGDARGAVVYDEYGVTDMAGSTRVAVDLDVERFLDLLERAFAELTRA